MFTVCIMCREKGGGLPTIDITVSQGQGKLMGHPLWYLMILRDQGSVQKVVATNCHLTTN